MDKRQLLHIIEWVVAIAACAFLIWKIATYDDYASLWAALRAMGWQQWTAVVLCIALMPVNMALEAWRWMTLMNEGTVCSNDATQLPNDGAKRLNDGMIDWREAQRQVYYSKLAGLITPWRLGEYPARALLLNEEMSAAEPLNERPQGGLNGALWAKVLSMGAVGSATMTAVIIVAGLAAWIIGHWSLAIGHWSFSYFLTVTVILLLLGVGLYFAPRLLKRWATVSHRLVAISMGQSFVRLVCWCVQLGLVLYALGAISNFPFVICHLFVYYLLVTITPNVPIVEVGVRGAWAIVVFGTMNAALAGVLLWVINTLLPCLIWPFIKVNRVRGLVG